MQRRTLAVVIAVLVIIGGSLIYEWLVPEVVDIYPTPGTVDVDPNTEIRLTFSGPMQPDSVIQSLQIRPAVEGVFEWEGDSIRFLPSEPFPRGVEVQVKLVEGALSALGLESEPLEDWSFTIRPILLAYLWPRDPAADLYALDPILGEIRRLTTIGGVLDYDIGEMGQFIYLSIANDQNGSALYELDPWSGDMVQVLDCEENACSSVQVSPDGTMIAYQREAPAEETLSAHSQIWLMELESGIPEMVSEVGNDSRLPQWSPFGILNYYDVQEQAYFLLNLESDDNQKYKNQTGEHGSWSPNGIVFVSPEIDVVESSTLRGPSGEANDNIVDESELPAIELFNSQLLSYNLLNEEISNLSRIALVEDISPTFSPNGRWIAFARKYLDEVRWTPGRQLWVMLADGSESRQITRAEDFKHTAFAWHPDGSQVALVRFNTTLLTDPPEIWLIEIGSEEGIRLVVGGFSPQWIP